MFLFLILGVLIGILAVIFAVQNIVPVTVTFLSWQVEGSMAFIIAAAIVTGLLISILVSIPEIVANYFTLKELRKRNKALVSELEEYKNAAIVNTSHTSATIS